MADNVTANQGTGGPVFATDQNPADQVHHPLEKIEWGAADQFNPVDDVTGKRLPVKFGDGLGAASVVAGELVVGAAQAQFPSVVARRFRIRRMSDDSDTVNPVVIGPTGLTLATGFPLWPGDTTPPLELSNLNALFAIAGAAGQRLRYFGEV